jgi:hypothetical protein
LRETTGALRARGCEEFVRAFVNRRGERSDSMLCFACGQEHLYTLLLNQVSASTMARSDRALAEAEALPKRLEKLQDQF